jgi:hypothetical protein
LSAAKVLKDLYGREPVNSFGPLKLQALQQAMIRADWTRKNINKQIQRIVRMFAWGVSQEVVKPDVAQALREVKGLHNGRTTARETQPVLPVEDSVVNATLEHLPRSWPTWRACNGLTGCRPEEVCDLASHATSIRREPVWAYRPSSHKTEHHGRERVIFIGPKGQDVLRPYLLRDKKELLLLSRRRREGTASEAARTSVRPPLHYGNRPGTNRAAKPRRSAGKHYTTASYRRAIHRACELAFGMPEELRTIPPDLPAEEKARRRSLASKWRAEHAWHPNQLRHSAATEIRKALRARGSAGDARTCCGQCYPNLRGSRSRKGRCRDGSGRVD